MIAWAVRAWRSLREAFREYDGGNDQNYCDGTCGSSCSFCGWR